MRRAGGAWFGLGIGLALLVLLFGLPLLTVLVESTRAPSTSSEFFWSVTRFTYWQAFWSAVGSAGLGLPGAWIYAEMPNRFRRFWAAATLIPFSLPPILLVLGLIGIWGRQGIAGVGIRTLGLDWHGLYGWPGILLAHSVFNFPLFVRFVGQALASGDRAEERTALSLGAGRWACFCWITWPKIRGAFWSAFLLSFLFCASSFLVVLVLGGGPRFTTIEVAIYQTLKQEFDLAAAIQLAALPLLVATAFAAVLYRTPMANSGRALFLPLYQPRNPRVGLAIQLVYGAVLSVLVALPLLWVVAQGVAFVPWGDLLPALLVSLRLAVCAGALAMALAVVLEWSARDLRLPWVRSLASVVCTLPLALSSLLILLGWRLLYPGLLLGSDLWWAVAAVQSVVALPVVYRAVREGFDRLAPEREKQARSLGASPLQVFLWVQWPTLRNSLALAFLLGVLIALGEAGAVLLFLDESTVNLTYLIYQSMSRYRFSEAYGVAVVLLLLTSLLAFAASRLEKESA